jgi:CRISPR-associated protein Csb1
VRASKEAGGIAEEGGGNIPYSRDEFSPDDIIAYFNLDLAQIHAFGFDQAAEDMLIALALFKVRRFLELGLRLRSMCDLEPIDDLQPVATRPTGFALPSTADLAAALPGLIDAVAKSFADTRVTTVTWTPEKGGKSKSRGKTKNDKDERPADNDSGQE